MKNKNPKYLTRGKVELLIFIFCLLFMFSASLLAQDAANISDNIDQTLNNPEAFQSSSKYNISLIQLTDTTTYEGRTYDYYLARYEKATRTRKIGRILIGVGLPACVVGFAGLGIAYAKGWGGQNDAGGYAGVGGFLFVSGFIAFNVGIPMAITGSIKRGNNRKAMEAGWPNKKNEWMLLSFGPTRNGIGLVMKF